MTAARTVGVIARELGQSLHRVEYVIKSRRIEPAFKAGNARVFDDQAFARIEEAIAEIDGKHN